MSPDINLSLLSCTFVALFERVPLYHLSVSDIGAGLFQEELSTDLKLLSCHGSWESSHFYEGQHWTNFEALYENL